MVSRRRHVRHGANIHSLKACNETTNTMYGIIVWYHSRGNDSAPVAWYAHNAQPPPHTAGGRVKLQKIPDTLKARLVGVVGSEICCATESRGRTKEPSQKSASKYTHHVQHKSVREGATEPHTRPHQVPNKKNYQK